MSRADLIQTYIEALNLTEVAVVGAGKRCRIQTGEIAPGEPVASRYYFKASHAELVLATIGKEDVTGKPPAALVDAIERAAAMLGAPFQTPDGLRKAAAEQVAEIVERVKMAGLSGKLKRWNAAYRQYRLGQLEKSGSGDSLRCLPRAGCDDADRAATRDERADGLVFRLWSRPIITLSLLLVWMLVAPS
jgi:hypothetical protein